MEIRRERGNKKGGERVRARAEDERSAFSFFSFPIRVDRVRLQNAGSIVGGSEKGTSTRVRRIIRFRL